MSLTTQDAHEIISEEIKHSFPDKYNYIPFIVRLDFGKIAIFPISLDYYHYHNIIYNHFCETSKKEIYAFRSKEDAELAVKINSWKYLGYS